MTISTKPMTAAELLLMPDDDMRHELIEGELIELTPPPKFAHGRGQTRIATALERFAQTRDVGEAVTETGFLISTNPDTVRAPDVAFISANRLPDENADIGYLSIAPDLVVEVISPSDRPGYVREKVRAWLDAGAKLVWTAYPATKSVTAHLPDGRTIEFTPGQILDGSPALDGFRIPISVLFGDRATWNRWIRRSE